MKRARRRNGGEQDKKKGRKGGKSKEMDDKRTGEEEHKFSMWGKNVYYKWHVVSDLVASWFSLGVWSRELRASLARHGVGDGACSTIGEKDEYTRSNYHGVPNLPQGHAQHRRDLNTYEEGEEAGQPCRRARRLLGPERPLWRRLVTRHTER